MYLQLLSVQLLSVQLMLIFFEFSFSKLSKLLNQKKLCFSLHIKKDFSTHVPFIYINPKKSFLHFC